MHTVLGFPDFLVIDVLVALFGGSSLALASRSAVDLATRNAGKLDAIIKHLNVAMPPISPPDELTDAVRALADGGETLEATRQYRVETGADTKEAKRAIDTYRSRPAV